MTNRIRVLLLVMAVIVSITLGVLLLIVFKDFKDTPDPVATQLTAKTLPTTAPVADPTRKLTHPIASITRIKGSAVIQLRDLKGHMVEGILTFNLKTEAITSERWVHISSTGTRTSTTRPEGVVVNEEEDSIEVSIRPPCKMITSNRQPTTHHPCSHRGWAVMCCY